MSRETRLDKLESDIVGALRRAPGAEPSAELDARIRARAHAAVAKPAKRPQPFWFSMAAGLVVLVGSGLALRIWQQVEHAPTALDAPPAASSPQPAATTPARRDESMPAPAGVAAESSERAAARAQSESNTLAPAKPTDSPGFAQSGAELRREQALIESKRKAMSDLVAGPETADSLLPPQQARPFPAEPAPIIAAEEPVSATASSAPVAAVENFAAPPAEPVGAARAPSAPATPSAQAPAAIADAGVALPESVAQVQAAKLSASEGTATASRDAAATDAAELDSDGERQRALADVADDPAFAAGVAAVRAAVAAGEIERARQLAATLRRDHPRRELPEDVLALVDEPQ